MTLAILGGKPLIGPGEIEPFNGIGDSEVRAAAKAIRSGPLSGFLGGMDRGGPCVRSLEDRWQSTFAVRHAIACNSATSGLLAACHAAGVNSKSKVLTTPFTMSATSACAAILGAEIVYSDIEDDTFCLDPDRCNLEDITHCIITNLFGHPAQLSRWKESAVYHGVTLIEDNAQSPFAEQGGKYAGTVGHMGVFSLNVHKHIQCGEGGVVVTDDDRYAERLRRFINHGELAGAAAGLNLRMTEYTAAIAEAQLNKAWYIIGDRIKQAQLLTQACAGRDWIVPPVELPDSDHVYYVWAAKLLTEKLGISRDIFVRSVACEGFPLKSGYVQPLYRLNAFSRFVSPCPVAETMHDRTLVIFENCGHTITAGIADRFSQILDKIEDNAKALSTRMS